MFFKRESNIKTISLFLSAIFFFNTVGAQSLSKAPTPSSSKVRSSSANISTPVTTTPDATESVSLSAAQRLQQEDKIKNFIKLWNQSVSLNQAIEQFAVSKEDKYFLHQVLKKEKLETQKPARVEYFPNKSKMVLSFADGKKAFWVLSMNPSLVLYDGKEVLAFHHQSSIPEFFPEYKNQFKALPPQKKKKKSTTSWMSFWISPVYAQTDPSTLTTTTTTTPTIPKTFSELHNEQIAKQQEVLKKVAKKQKNFTQSLLWFIGLGAGVSLSLMAVSKAASVANRHMGSEGYTNLQNDIEKLKTIYPEIDNSIFNGGAIEIKSFSCGTLFNKNAPIRKIRFQTRDRDDGEERSRVEHDIDLYDTPSMKEELIKGENKELSQKIQTLDRCCQNIPCDKWLEERLKDNQKVPADGESNKSFQEVGEFIEEKEREAKKSIGTK